MRPTPASDRRVPPPGRRAAALLLVEGAALGAVGIVDAVATATGAPADRALSFTVAAFGGGTGLLLGLLARAVAAGRGWARSPAVVLQLLALPVGVGLLQGRVWAAAAPVLVLAGATLWQLAVAGPGERGSAPG